MDEESVGVALVVTSAVGFGTLGVLGVLAADVGLSIPTVLAFRFALATVIVWAILWYRDQFRLLTGRPLAVALALGGLGYATMSGMYFLGLEFMTAGMVAIVLYTYPAFVVCLAALSNPDRVTAPVVVALGLSLGGVALITGANPAGADPRGVAIVLVGAFAYAVYIAVSQRLLVTVDARTLTAFVMPAAAASFTAIGLTTGTLALPGGQTAWGVTVAIAVVATAVPILTFFAGIARIGASRASIISTVEPGVTVALGAAVLGEPVTAVTVGGGVLVVLGVVLVQRAGT